MTDEDVLAKAIQLIQAGEKDTARSMLEPFLRQNPNHVRAWIWEAELFPNDNDKIKVLEACLKYNPDNLQVTQALTFLRQRLEASRQPVVPVSPFPPVSSSKPPFLPEKEEPAGVPTPKQIEAKPVVSPVRLERVSPKPAGTQQKPARKKNPAMTKAIAAVAVVVVLCGVVGLYLAGGYYQNAQINNAFASENCTEVVQYSFFVSIYPRGIFGSLFNGFNQYDECSILLAFEQAVTAKNWENAIFSIQQYLAYYPNGTFVDRINEQAPNIFVTRSQELIAKHDYVNGIEKLKRLVEGFPNSPPAQSAPDTILQTYIQWAKEATDSQDYTDAEQSLKTALSYFESDTARAGQIKQELAAVYIAWGDTQIQMGDMDNGIKHYGMAGEISPDSVDVNLLVARARLQQAIEIAGRQDFDRAMAKVQEIIDSAQSDNVRAEANAVMEKVLTAYSESTSQQAQDRITAAINQVCQGQRPELPSLFGRATAPIRIGVVNFSLTLPVELAAQSPGELHYVMCITEEQDTIQSCPYQNGHTLFRIRYVWHVKLYDILTGEESVSQTFNGSAPDACHSVELFSNSSNIRQSFGNRPGVDEIVAWLAKLNITQ